MIEARNLTKHFGDTVAVDDLSFDVKPGMVTGFLGPNGAGKTTTMRMILGLDHPNGGQVTVAGRRYRDLPAPLHEVGALLDAKAVHGGRRRVQSPAAAWPRATAFPPGGSTRYFRSSASSRWPCAGRPASRWVWGSASASPRPCLAIRRS